MIHSQDLEVCRWAYLIVANTTYIIKNQPNILELVAATLPPQPKRTRELTPEVI